MVTEKQGSAAAAKNELQNDLSNKLLVCLAHLHQRGNAGLNTLEANQAYNDTCLHTTIYQIGVVYHIKPKRQYETLTNRDGRSTRYMRYWLDEEQRERAAEILGYGVDGGSV